MPPAYLKCITTVSAPDEIIRGHRAPQSEEERQVVCAALEEIVVGFIELYASLQIALAEQTNEYSSHSRERIMQTCASCFLRAPVTERLTYDQYAAFDARWKAVAAPFEETIKAETSTFFSKIYRYLGTLYVFGVPLIATFKSRADLGRNDVNAALSRVGSKLHFFQTVMYSSVEYLLGELIPDKCSEQATVFGKELARSAGMIMEVASTQDTAEKKHCVYRMESVVFIIHHKVVFFFTCIYVF
jgi:hypothetical protein